MVDTKYSIAYSEVLEILKNISPEDYNKIPKSKIELYKANASKEYVFNYNKSKTLDEQNVSKIAKGIIAILFRDYWATPEQRDKIIKKQNNDRKQIEEEKRKKYNSDLFSSNNNKEKIKTETLVNVKKQKVYEKIFTFIRKILLKL